MPEQNTNQELLTPIRTYDVTNDDVIKEGEHGKYYIYLQHNLDLDGLLVQWYDENGNIRSHTGNIVFLSRNVCLIYVGSEITGTHKVYILQDKSNMLRGRRLFDQPIVTSEGLDETYRFAVGRPGYETKNISLRDFSDGMADLLGNDYLRIANSLSEFQTAQQKATARTNLGTYSQAQTDANFLQKDDPNNLGILSQYVPAAYQNQTNVPENTILTYGLAQRMEHNNQYTQISATPWSYPDSDLVKVHTSLLTSTIKFSIVMDCAGNASSYGYTHIGSIQNAELVNKFSNDLDNLYIYACEGMPLLNVGTGTSLTYPSSVAHMQIQLDKANNRLKFYALNTVTGRSGMRYIFNGTIIIPD